MLHTLPLDKLLESSSPYLLNEISREGRGSLERRLLNRPEALSPESLLASRACFSCPPAANVKAVHRLTLITP